MANSSGANKLDVEKLSISLPKTLVKRIDKKLKKTDKKRSQYFRELALKDLEPHPLGEL